MTFDLSLTGDQEAIVASVRSVLEAPVDWRRCADLGWFGLGLPESAGGVGYGVVEEVLLQRELGRALVSGPFITSVLAARVAWRAGEVEVTDALTTGRQRAGIVLGSLLIDVGDGDAVLTVDPDGAALYDAPAFVDRTNVVPIDGGSSVRRTRRAGGPRVTVVGREHWLRLLVLCAAQLTGLAERARDLAVDHAINRRQFGKPIGVNQAVKHPCVEMAVRAELAFAQLLVSARALDNDATDAHVEAASSAAVAIDAALENGRAAIQVHGGIGFTTEHPVHQVVERAHLLERMLGGRAAVLDVLVERVTGGQVQSVEH